MPFLRVGRVPLAGHVRWQRQLKLARRRGSSAGNDAASDHLDIHPGDFSLAAHVPQSKATTIKDAITKFEEKSGAPVSGATCVKLLSQLPPIEKMDAALSQIAHVESVDAACKSHVTTGAGSCHCPQTPSRRSPT